MGDELGDLDVLEQDANSSETTWVSQVSPMTLVARMPPASS